MFVTISIKDKVTGKIHLIATDDSVLDDYYDYGVGDAAADYAKSKGIADYDILGVTYDD